MIRSSDHQSSTKVLFTSVIRPFGGPGEGDSVGAELFHAQVTRAQGPFSLRQTIRVWAIDYLAANIEAPAVTLHYPSKKELVRELRAGGYTHVGINFVVATFHKVREMVPLIREHAPDAKIILGGYGTVLPDEILGRWSDAICREEGIAFMRKFLGEVEGAPIHHPHSPVSAPIVLSYPTKGVVGHVTAGLGCPNGCDFCCTSHFFKRKYHPLAERGRDIYEALIATRERARADGQEMSSHIVIDEDFFIHKHRAREFLDCMREGGEALSLMGFGSVRGISQFTAREIAEMGFHLIWNAFEGTKAGYSKQQGRPIAELYRDLKSVGCAQLTSMIIGFPYQDEATIRAEFEQLMALEPTMTQCLIYFAFPGTPFHEQVIAEGRYRELYRREPDLRRWDGFAMHFEHPNMGPEKVEELQREIYRQDFVRLGASTVRLAKVWLEGYQNLRNDANPLLAARAEGLRESVRIMFPVARAAAIWGPTREFRQAAGKVHKDIIRITGAQSISERALDTAAALVAYPSSRFASKLGILQQPGLLRTEHRVGPDSAATRNTNLVSRMQGGFFSGIGGVLVEDGMEHLRQLAARIRPRTEPLPRELRAVTAKATGMPSSVGLPEACPHAERLVQIDRVA